MQILLHSGPGIISWLIRLQTRGNYSHASVLFSDGAIFEAREGRGLQQITVDDVLQAMLEEPRLQVDVFDLPAHDEAAARRFAEVALLRQTEARARLRWWQIWRKTPGYDYRMVFRFITRLPATEGSADNWFCSEWAVALAGAAGVCLLRNIESWAVSPFALSTSPRLRPLGDLAVWWGLLRAERAA